MLYLYSINNKKIDFITLKKLFFKIVRLKNHYQKEKTVKNILI